MPTKLFILSLLILAHLASSKKIALPNGYLPEGITRGPGSTLFVGSLTTGAISQINARTETVSILVPPSQTTGRLAAGLAYTGGMLFVAGISTFRSSPTGPVLGKFFVYGVPGGNTIANCAVRETSFLNDVVIRKGIAYFTDSQSRNLVVVPVATARNCSYSIIELPKAFALKQPGQTRANGIEHYKGHLIIANSNLSTLYSYDLLGRFAPRRLLPLGGVGRPDGLIVKGDMLYVVERTATEDRVSVWKIRFRNDKLALSSVATITARSLQTPSTAAIFGRKIYIVNARFAQIAGGDITKKQFYVTSVPLSAAKR